MNKLFRKSILPFLASLLITSTVYASPNENTATTLRQNIENIQINIEKLDNSIETAMKKTDENNKQILDTIANIKTTEKELKDAENTLDIQKDLFNKRVRAMYIRGFDGYLNVLLDSKNFSELLSNTDMLVKLINLDETTIDKYTHNKDFIITKKNNLTIKNNTLCALKLENEKELAKLNANKEEQKKLLVASLAAENSYYSSEDQISLTEALKYIDSIKNKASNKTYSRGQGPLDIDTVIAYAASFLKTPYVWGGTSPNPGFDCSGFTQYVCAHFGVSIGRTTYDQIKDGVEVKRADLKPGDLILFGTPRDPHHVGMYIGFGAYIHAPHTGDFIKISPLTRGDYLTARRVLGN